MRDAFVDARLCAARVCVDDQNKPGAPEEMCSSCLLYFGTVARETFSMNKLVEVPEKNKQQKTMQ